MTERQPRAAVLGAGVMGTGIAAHLAGAGIPTLLLDIVPEGATGPARSRLAQEAIGKALKARPTPFFDADVAQLIRPGNLDDDLKKLASCDFVIEAVTERMDIKQALLKRLAEAVGSKTIIASNTSGLSVAKMAEALPEDVAKRFIVMHFFNPVRYMHLVEVVSHPTTSQEVVDRTVRFAKTLGKGVVFGKDTVNFVANRIGVFAMMHAIHAMERFGMTIEDVDQIAGPPMGRPASAAYRTADLVGIDTLAHVAQNCLDADAEDPAAQTFVLPGWVKGMLDAKRLGAKTGEGFYKKAGADILVFDVESRAYRPQNKTKFDSVGAVRKVTDAKERVKKLVAGDDAAAKFAWDNVAHTLCYAAARMGEIADDVVNIDRAMRWGFNWDVGPFELWDALGVKDTVARMQGDGLTVPEWVLTMLAGDHHSFYGTDGGHLSFYDVAKGSRVLLPVDAQAIDTHALAQTAGKQVSHNPSASLLDGGDGALILQVHSKMNIIDLDVMAMVEEGVQRAQKDFRALVLANDGAHFGAGFNLMLLHEAIKKSAWSDIEAMIARFQQVGQLLRYCTVPTVSAPFNLTLGGALELAMATDACQAHAESYMGLVEAGVGLVPGGGGCLRLLERATADARIIDGVDLLPAVGMASLQVATAKTSSGAHEARKLFYLRATDGISLNRAHLTAHAKARALGLAAAGYTPPVPPLLKAAGADAEATIKMRVWAMTEGRNASPHDGKVAGHIARILTGGQVPAGATITEQHVLDLEREAFLSLCGEEKTQARIESMMLTNKPLRN